MKATSSAAGLARGCLWTGTLKRVFVRDLPGQRSSPGSEAERAPEKAESLP